MTRSLLAFAITLSASLVPTASAGVLLFDSPDGSGLNGRFGLASAPGTAPNGAAALEISGEPTQTFSDLIAIDPTDNNSVFDLDPALRGGEFTLSFDVYIPTGSNLDAGSPFIRFIGDADDNGSISFGSDGEFATRVDLFGAGIDFSLVDQFQPLIVEGTIPEVDNAGELIDLLQFNLGLNQNGGSGVAGPVSAFVNNVRLEVTPAAVPEPSAFALLALTGLAAAVRRRV